MTIPANRTLQSTVRRLQGTNVIQPLLAGGAQKRQNTVYHKHGREKKFSFIGFFICSLLSLKEFPLSVSRVNIRIPVSPCCPSKDPVGLATFFYSHSSLSCHQAMQLSFFRKVTVRFYSNSYSRMQLKGFVFLLFVTYPHLYWSTLDWNQWRAHLNG